MYKLVFLIVFILTVSAGAGPISSRSERDLNPESLKELSQPKVKIAYRQINPCLGIGSGLENILFFWKDYYAGIKVLESKALNNKNDVNSHFGSEYKGYLEAISNTNKLILDSLASNAYINVFPLKKILDQISSLNSVIAKYPASEDYKDFFTGSEFQDYIKALDDLNGLIRNSADLSKIPLLGSGSVLNNPCQIGDIMNLQSPGSSLEIGRKLQ